MAQLVIFAGIVVVIFFALGFILNILNIVVMVAVWMIAGYLAGKFIRGKGYGPVGDIALGLLGGIIGTILLSAIGLGGLTGMWIVGKIIAGVIGGIALIYLVRFFHDTDFAK